MQMQNAKQKGKRKACVGTNTYIYIIVFRKQTISAFAHAFPKLNIPNPNKIRMTLHLFDDSEAGYVKRKK